MFAPEGYVSLFEIVNQLRQQGRFFELQSSFDDGFVLPDIHGLSSIRCVQDLIEASATWLISHENFKATNLVPICSPSGKVINISSEVLTAFGDPFWSLEEAHGTLDNQTDFFLSLLGKFGVGIHIELEILEYITDWGNRTVSRRFPLFFDRRTYTITNRNYGQLEELFDRRFPEDDFSNFVSDELMYLDSYYSRILGQFEGWSICAKKEVLDRLNEIPSSQHFKETGYWPRTADKTDTPKPGRPRHQIEKAMEIVDRSFGDQRHAFTAKEIYRKLGDPVGQFSLKTLKRALVELDKNGTQN